MSKKTLQSPFAIIAEWLQAKGITARFNSLIRDIEFNGEPVNERELNSYFITIVGTEAGSGINDKEWHTYLDSNHVPTYSPIEEYLGELKDKPPVTGNIAALAATLSLDPSQGMPPQVAEMFLRKWLIGLVAGVFFDYYNAIFLILSGGKNIGKTEFFRRLLPERINKYFAETKLDGGKDEAAVATSNWVLFIDEMDFLTRKKDAADLRKFISTNYFTYRPPYARKPVTVKRIASMCGASNEIQVITDPANNRRLVPIVVTAIDHDAYNAIDKEALITEALHLYMDGEEWHLNKEDIRLLEQYTGINAAHDTETEFLQKYFIKNDDGFMTSSEVAADLQTRTVLRISSWHVGKALAALGFERTAKKINGSTRYGWKVRTIDAPPL